MLNLVVKCAFVQLFVRSSLWHTGYLTFLSFLPSSFFSTYLVSHITPELRSSRMLLCSSDCWAPDHPSQGHFMVFCGSPWPMASVCTSWWGVTHQREFDLAYRQNWRWDLGNRPGSFSLNRAIRCDVYVERTEYRLSFRPLFNPVKRLDWDGLTHLYSAYLQAPVRHLYHIQTHVQPQLDSMVWFRELLNLKEQS